MRGGEPVVELHRPRCDPVCRRRSLTCRLIADDGKHDVAVRHGGPRGRESGVAFDRLLAAVYARLAEWTKGRLSKWGLENVHLEPWGPFGRGWSLEGFTINLVEPGSMYGDRLNQLDFRVAKILRFGRSRTTVGFDVYNLVNSDAVLTYNQTFSPTTTTWLRPTSVIQARFVKFSAQVDF